MAKIYRQIDQSNPSKTLKTGVLTAKDAVTFNRAYATNKSPLRWVLKAAKKKPGSAK